VFASVRFIRPEPVLPVLARLRLVPWLAALLLLALPAAAQAAGNVYVATGVATGTANVSQYAIDDGGRLSPLSPATVAAGLDPYAVAVTPDGKSVYVTGYAGVSQYNIDPLGALSPKTPAAVPAGTLSTLAIAVAPDGKSAYATGSEPHSGFHILQYDIDRRSGALSLKTPAEVGAGFVALAVVVTPDGNSAYVTDIFAGALRYDIDPHSGALSPKTPANVLTGGFAEAVAVTPDGKSAYFVNFNNATPNNTVAQFDIDPSSGLLSPKTPAVVATGPSADSVAISPDGKSAYVSSFGVSGSPGSGSVWQYAIDPGSGALSPKTPPIVATGGSPSAVAVAPDGKSAYVTNFMENSVWQFDIAAVSGALSPKTPPSVAAAGSPGAIAVAPRVPTGREQCGRAGWRNFPRFRNRGQCVAFVERRR
jgi:DNA-binding beta-propeller fold protein YncE